MTVQKVLFVDARSRNTKESLVLKLGLLFDEMDMAGRLRGKNVAIKTHFGSLYCTRYLRPHYIRKIVDKVKEAGGEPFVTDTTALDLRSERGMASKHLEVAAMHGFTQQTLGAPIVIADGFYGNDYIPVNMDGQQLKCTFIAKAIYGADLLISVAHFKGHGLSGIGGACKNLSLGCTSKLGKNFAHYYDFPKVGIEKCNGCSECVAVCPVKAITMVEGKAAIDEDLCFACRECIKVCELKAIGNRRVTKTDFNLRLADTVYGLTKLMGKENIFCFNLIIDVDWLCDCEHLQQGWSDVPIVPDIGITASDDPVAIDQASTDLVNQSQGIPGSKAEEMGALKPGVDKFKLINGVSPLLHLEASEKLGVGTRNYDLIKME